MIKWLPILVFAFIAEYNVLLPQMIPSCWCKPEYNSPNGEHFNTHFYYDTCYAQYSSSNCDSAYQLNIMRAYDSWSRIYAKRTWLIWFDVKAFPLPKAPQDTIIEVTWEDVDSLSYPDIKDSLSSMEQIYGIFKLRKVNPQFTEPTYGQEFEVFFSNYVNGVELESKFRSINYAHCDFSPGGWEKSNKVNTIINTTDSIYIFPNPTTGKINVRLNDYEQNTTIKLYTPTSILFNEYHLTSTQTELDLSQYPNGIYFLQIGDEFRKVVVMK